MGSHGDAAKLRARIMLEERCSDGTLDALFRESAPPRPGDDPAVVAMTEPASKESPSSGSQTWMRGWSREWWSVQAEDMSVVQTELQVLRGDNKPLHEQLS